EWELCGCGVEQSTGAERAMTAAAPSVSLFAHVRRFPPPRRRGGQPGNKNRLRHGGFSQVARTRRAHVRALIAKMEVLILEAKLLHAAEQVGLPTDTQTPLVIPGEQRARQRTMRGRSEVADDTPPLVIPGEHPTPGSSPVYGGGGPSSEARWWRGQPYAQCATAHFLMLHHSEYLPQQHAEPGCRFSTAMHRAVCRAHSAGRPRGLFH